MKSAPSGRRKPPTPERPATERWAAAMLSDIAAFSYLAVGRPLYGYQLAPARAILDSVLHQRGREFAVLFPRQAGKNETQAQVEAYLLTLFQRVPGASIVRAQPTFRPQALNARLRLERALNAPRLRLALAGAPPRRRFDYLLQVREAQVFFFSAAPSANVVGATATLLLHCDEAQDVRAAEWARKFVPMGASSNVTVAYWGTAWTARTLLAETIRRLQAQEAVDGLQRVFRVTPEQVAAENPAYGAFVARQVAQLGRDHPLVRTQFFNEALEAEAGLFPPARRALMQGEHAAQAAPQPGADYAFLLDVAGEDEGAVPSGLAGSALANPHRDATALTIVQVEVNAATAGPVYRAVRRQVWVGVGQPELLAALRALAAEWQPRRVVVDATGLGAGLAGFLARALPPGVVVPVDFNSATKSRLGWQFLAVCDTGRWQEWQPGAAAALDPLQTTFWRQAEACAYTVQPGPGRVLAWGVPDGTRDPATGELIHDDLLLSAALCAVLDEQPWYANTGPGVILRAADPLEAMSRGF